MSETVLESQGIMKKGDFYKKKLKYTPIYGLYFPSRYNKLPSKKGFYKL